MAPRSENYARFFLVLLLTALINFLFSTLFNTILGNFSLSSITTLILRWVGYGSSTVLATYLSVLVIYHSFSTSDKSQETASNTLRIEKSNSREKEPSEILFEGLRTNNFFSQLKDGFFLFVCIYIPLDFIGYTIPGVLEYSANSLGAATVDNPTNYFQFEFGLMILTTLIIHFFVAFREEFLYREFFLTMGKEELRTPVVYFYSALLFGLAHVNYIFLPENSELSIFFPIWWGLNGLLIGLIAGAYFWKKRRLFPVIFAHWLNNVLSAVVVRNHVLGVGFWNTTFLFIYLPLLTIGVVGYIFKLFPIKDIWQTIRSNWEKYRNSISSWKYVAIDIVLVLFLWLVMMAI
ncbi:MAG: lysostaphin resistance A-like protein [Promethearchaeota archaeon]